MALETEIIIAGAGEKDEEEIKDIIRCLQTLYGSETGQQILDRDFGLDADILDLPLNAAAAKLAQEIIEKTEKYEPRAEVAEVTPEVGEDGTLKIKVTVTLAEEEE